MSLPLACLGGEADLLGQEIDRLHGPVTLVRRCADMVELLAVVRSGLALAVLIDEDEPELSAPVLDRLVRDSAVAAVVVTGAGEAGPVPAGPDPSDQDAPGQDARSVPGPDAQPAWEHLGAVAIPAQLPAALAAQLLIEASERPASERPMSQRPASEHPAADGPSDSGRARADEPGPVPESPLDRATGRGERGRGREDEAADPDPLGALSGPDDVVSGAAGSPRGRVVVVWGPHGSPGRSTTAINLAAECAGLGAQVTLVDLDTWGPSIAALLGLLDETAGVALACRAADRDRLTPEALERAAVQVQVGRSRITVLTGLTRPERWPELRESSVRRLLRACQHVPLAERPPAPATREAHGAAVPAPVIIVDVGASVEEDEELVSDLEAPRRSAATTAALAEADLVLAVCAAEVLGVPRAARALPAVLELTPAPVMLVANRVRRSAAGSSPRAALREAWAVIGAPGQWDAHLTWDPRSVDAAALAGSVLAESAPGSALRGQLRDLAGAVLRRLDGDLSQEQGSEEPEDVRGTGLGRAMGGWLRR